MATAHVQTKTAQIASGTNAAISLTGVVAGNHLVAGSSAWVAQSTTPGLTLTTSTPSATWANGIAPFGGSPGGAAYLEQRADYSENVASGSWTVNCGSTSSGVFITALCSESSGVATSSSKGLTGTKSQHASPSTTITGSNASITPTAGSILYSFVNVDYTGAGSSSAATVDSSFTVTTIGGASTNWDANTIEAAGSAYKANVAASAVNPTWTTPSAQSADMVACLIEFLAASTSTTPSSSDSATVTDSVSNIKLSGPSDTSSETDTNKIGLGNTDSSTVSEQVGGIKLNAADAVTEAEQILGINLGSSDTATEAESTSATAQVSASDSGTLTDSASASQNGGTTPSGSEGGSTSETASVSASIAAAEIGTLAEQVAIRVSSSDSGSFAEQVANALLASAEGLAIVEQYQIAVSASAIDTAAVQEAVQLAIRLVAQDSAHMGDSQSVSTSGVSSIPFKTVVAQARTLTFVAQSRGLTFIAQTP